MRQSVLIREIAVLSQRWNVSFAALVSFGTKMEERVKSCTACLARGYTLAKGVIALNKASTNRIMYRYQRIEGPLSVKHACGNHSTESFSSMCSSKKSIICSQAFCRIHCDGTISHLPFALRACARDCKQIPQMMYSPLYEIEHFAIAATRRCVYVSDGTTTRTEHAISSRSCLQRMVIF